MGENEKTSITGTKSDVAVIWFDEKIPMHAPKEMEITKPAAITPR